MIKLDPTEVSECLPYEGDDFIQSVERLFSSSELPGLVQSVFPGLTFENLEQTSKAITDAESFQKTIISVVMDALQKQTTEGVTLSGIESLSSDEAYLYLSNHRDIICDPALVCYNFNLNRLPTPKVCLGDNLLVNQLVVDLVKMNKGITVKRNLAARDLLKWSRALSSVIRSQILNRIDSVWIAHREGRAKDGNDRTHPGVLKMLAMAGDEDLLKKIQNLRIIPLAISYEYDPCDALKARELCLTELNGSYQKAPGEDVVSMLTGVKGQKGRIHIAVGNELTSDLEELAEKCEKTSATHFRKDLIGFISEIVDRQIHLQYRKWPTNYLAYDLLEGSSDMAEHYTPEEKRKFLARMSKQLENIKPLNLGEGTAEKLQRQFLKIYANPVYNYLAAK